MTIEYLGCKKPTLSWVRDSWFAGMKHHEVTWRFTRLSSPSGGTVGGRNPAPLYLHPKTNPRTPSLTLGRCLVVRKKEVEWPKSCTTSMTKDTQPQILNFLSISTDSLFPSVSSVFYASFTACSMYVQCTFTVSSLRAHGTCRKKYEVCQGRRGKRNRLYFEFRLCSFCLCNFCRESTLHRVLLVDEILHHFICTLRLTLVLPL